ncbi:MAG: peptidoglycan editing factor PgeF [Bacillota bacterium]
MHHYHKGFTHRENGGVEFAVINSFEQTGLVRHGFTTRKGGVSTEPFNALNLNRTRGDAPLSVEQNYLLMCEALNIPLDALVLVNYEHGARVHRVGAADIGKGITRPTDLPHCDGLITDEPGVALLTLHADCMGLFLLDPVKKSIGVCHAGWKGVAQGMGTAMVLAMEEAYGSKPSDLLCGITAHIRSCCFEVGAPVAKIFRDAFPGAHAVLEREGKKPAVDLEACMLDMLLGAGVLEEHITMQQECTSCMAELYYSHRRDRGKTGSMASVLMLTGAGRR